MDPLPPKRLVLAACRGDVPQDDPLLRWVGELAGIHRRLLGCGEFVPVELDRLRAGLVRDIDLWVARQLPPAPGGARLHTETLGMVIDRLARFSASAHAALAGTVDLELWDAWERLAELAVGYEDLTDEVSSGRRRLPCAQ
ncbi:DUF4254 domain-containing protein [Nocardia sp. NPDC055321]